MKRILIKLMLAILICATVITCTGCTFGIRARAAGKKIDPSGEQSQDSDIDGGGSGGGSGSGSDGSESSGEMGEGSKVISISIYAAGNGSKWLQNAISVYLKNNPNADVTFQFTANPLMFGTVYDKLKAGTCEDDIVLVADQYYRELANAGKLVDITDTVLNKSIPDDTAKKCIDVIPQSHLTYRNVKGKQYGVPWQDNVSPGFIYNKKLFEERGWNTSPETMTQFFNLCSTIVKSDANMYAFAYGGNADYGYWPGVLNKWFVDYFGYDYIANTFQKYDNPQYYTDTQAGRKKIYETFANCLSLKGNGKTFVHPNSKGISPNNAQMKLLNGEVAMVLCGNWFPQEMSKILSSAKYKDFEYGFMPMPHINDNKKTWDGKDSSSDRYSLNTNCLSVPTTAKHKEEAYDFLRWMFTRESYASFVEANNGLTRPITVQLGEEFTSSLNPFAKSFFDFVNAGKASGKFVYENSMAIMSRNGNLAMFNPSASGSNMINNIIQNPAVAKNEIESHVQNETDRAWSYWNQAEGKWDDFWTKDEEMEG